MHPEFSETEAPESKPLSLSAEVESSNVQSASEAVGRSRGLAGSRGILLGIGIGAAIALIGVQLTKPPANPTPTATSAETIASQTVTVSRAQATPVEQTLQATGTVQAFDLLPIAPQVSGLQIRQVLVEEGNRIQAGQVLAVLDDTVLQAQIQQAQAQVESAQAAVQQRRAALSQAVANRDEAQRNFERYRSLAEAGAISQQELDARRTTATTAQEAVGVAQADIGSAEANVRSTQAEVQRLRSQLEQTSVRSPAAGLIAERNARVGNVASTSDPLFSLIRDDRLELQVQVPETQLPQVRLGAPVQITSDADRRIQVQGRVREIAPLVNAENRQATVKIDLPESEFLRPGMFLKANIVTERSQGLTIPADAVIAKANGESIVYVLTTDNLAEERVLELGTRIPDDGSGEARIEVLSGLQSGDRVIVSGAGYVQDGDRVEVVQ